MPQLSLTDCDPLALDAVIAVLSAKFPPITITDASRLCTEEARYCLAYEAGRRAAVEELLLVRARQRREATSVL